MEMLPDRQSVKHLIGLAICIAIVASIVSVSELIDYTRAKWRAVTIDVQPPLANLVLPHPTSTKPFKFNPLTKGPASTTPQFVLLSFDGSKSVEMWKDTIRFANEMNAVGVPLHFTYFINSAYFLVSENKDIYNPPHEARGNSAIGYADSLESINSRVREINLALSMGHEIGSHAAGHWLGGGWSIEDWQQEQSSFLDLFFNYKKNNPQYNFSETLNLQPHQIKGFRAPSLSINRNMYEALSRDGYYYDSSEISPVDEWPHKDNFGIWHIPISSFYFPRMSKSVIAVDYSIWVNQTNGENTIKRGTQEWDIERDALISAYVNHLEKNYNSNRAPIVIDNHFSTWNDGLYWEALKGFAQRVCGRPNIRCSTFSDLVEYME
jgi:hypothetical protein